MTQPFVVGCDLDGVIWRGDAPIPGAAVAVDGLRAAGFRVAFLTDNSSNPVAAVAEKLARFGIEASLADIASSAQAAAALLAGILEPGARVLACAGPGVVEAMTERGFDVVDDGPADAVVVGWHRDFDFEGMRRASDAIRAGARYIATNLDPTYPTADGLVPGAGSIAAAVTTASGRTPLVAGKPEAATVALVNERFGKVGVMVGDRPSTDGALAAALGWPFALVLSGVAGTDGEEAVPDPPPPFVAADLAVLAPQLVASFGASAP